MAEIEKELKMQYIKIDEKLSIYEYFSTYEYTVNRLIESSYLAAFVSNTLSKNTYALFSNFDPIDCIGNINLLDNTWDIARIPCGDDLKMGLGYHKADGWWFKNTPFFSIVFHRSVSYDITKVIKKIQNIICDLLKKRGFDVIVENNDLKFKLNGNIKKFSAIRPLSIGEYFIVNSFVNLDFDTDILEVIAKKDIIKDGKNLNIQYNKIVGGLSEIKTFDVNSLYLEIAQEIATFFRLELISKQLIIDDMNNIKNDANKYKDMDWIMNGRAKEDALDRNSIKEAKIALGIEEIDLGKPPAMQYDEDIDKFPEFKAKLEAKRNVDPILTPKKKEVKNNGSKIRRWY